MKKILEAFGDIYFLKISGEKCKCAKNVRETKVKFRLYEGHSRSNNTYFLPILVTLMRWNFAHVLRTVTLVRTKSFHEFNKFCKCLVYVMMNWKETLPSNCEVGSIVHFLTIENKTKASSIGVLIFWKRSIKFDRL